MQWAKGRAALHLYHKWAGDREPWVPITYKVLGAEVTNFSQDQLQVGVLNGALGKAKWELVAGILSSGPIQTLDVSRVVML